MSTDKTLADVQPGGRVRLGDQAELDRLEFQAWAHELLPCPFCGNGAEFVPYKDNGLTLKCKSMGCIQRNQRTLRYGIDWLRTSMAEHWNTRALSAQPSPGGQDALLDQARKLFDELGAIADDYRCVAILAAALAARQPVGLRLILCRDSYPPLVAHSSSYGGIWTSDWCLVVDLNGSACSARYQVSDFDKRSMDANGGVPNAVQNDPWRVPGFGRVVAWAKASDVVAHISRSADAAPPAQAVDLGQFRDLAEFALSNAKLHNCWEKSEALARELLALIDGKAVGK